MGKRTDIGANRHGHALRDLFAEFLNLEIEHFTLAGRLFWRGRVVGEIFEDGERRHRKDLLLFHQADGFVRELIGVVDRRHARLRCK